MSVSKNKRIRYCIILCIWGLSCWQMTAANPLSFDAWKIQQEQHDVRLKPLYAKQPLSIQTITRSHTVLPLVKTHAEPNVIQPEQVIGQRIKVNINRASATELSAKLEKIGAKKALAIVAYRNTHGPFKQISELQNVKGVGAKIYEVNRQRLTLSD